MVTTKGFDVNHGSPQDSGASSTVGKEDDGTHRKINGLIKLNALTVDKHTSLFYMPT